MNRLKNIDYLTQNISNLKEITLTTNGTLLKKYAKELKEKGITDKNILNAIKKVPRKIFVDKLFLEKSYENIPLPINCNQTISQPYVVVYMIGCLKLQKTNKVLEIGTGTGYQTAIISHLCQKIYTIEIFDKLFNQTKINIGKLKIKMSFIN